MKKIFGVFIAFLWAMSGTFAQNLIPNPTFEMGPSTFCGVYSGPDFDGSLDNWYTPTGGTPDLFSTQIMQNCWNFQPNTTFAGPICTKGPQLPKSGTRMAGLFTRTIPGLNQREYIQTQLTQPLTPGRYYEFSFYISAADNHEMGTNNLGGLLSVNPVSIGTDGVLQQAPQVLETSVITDTSAWTEVIATFQAAQAFEYFTIGNFSDDNNTDTILNPGASGSPGCYGGYYFIDDCMGREVAPPVNLSDQTLCLGDSATLDPGIPAAYTNVRYLWTTGATSPTITVLDQGFYGVQITIDDTLVIGDTIFVDVEMCPPTLDMANVFTPNNDGVNDLFRPVTFSRLQNATMRIFDRWGNLLYESKDMNAGWSGTHNGEQCPEGVYYWTVTYRGLNQKSARMAGNLTLLR